MDLHSYWNSRPPLRILGVLLHLPRVVLVILQVSQFWVSSGTRDLGHVASVTIWVFGEVNEHTVCTRRLAFVWPLCLLSGTGYGISGSDSCSQLPLASSDASGVLARGTSSSDSSSLNPKESLPASGCAQVLPCLVTASTGA